MNHPGPSHSQTLPVITQEKAEETFRWFIKAVRIQNKQALLSKTETKTVFSFETYLRNAEYNEAEIEKFCRLVKDSDYVKRVLGDVAKQRKEQSKRIVVNSFKYGAIISLVLYLLSALVLKLFGISIWTIAHFLYFLAGGSVLVILGWLGLSIITYRNYKRGIKQRAAQQEAAHQPVYYIQIFDNEPVSIE